MSAAPYLFPDLPSFSQSQVALWNWYLRAVPNAPAWQDWVTSAFSELLHAPANAEAWIEESHATEKRPTVRHVINKPETKIGRIPSSDIVLSAPVIASNHARIFRDNDAYVIEDLGSRLGTFIEKRKLASGETFRLSDGDRIMLFPYTLEFHERQNWAPESHVQLTHGEPAATRWGRFCAHQGPGRIAFAVRIEPGYGSACFDAERSFLEQLIARALHPLPASTGVGDIGEAVLELILLRVLDRASAQLKFPLRLALGKIAEPPRIDDAEWGIAVSFCIALSGLSGAFRLFVPAESLAALRAEAPAAGEDWTPEIAWTLHAAAGHVDFTPAELLRVEPGDVVLFTEAPRLLWPNAWNRGWKTNIDRANPARLTIEHPLENTFTMDEQELDQLPVRIHVVLAEKELTLAEIKALHPGAILDLPRGKDEPVRLVANGKLVGDGELVDIEGRLGVRILNWKKQA